MKWRCSKCGGIFESEPVRHGNFLVTFGQPAEDKPCDGEVVPVEGSEREVKMAAKWLGSNTVVERRK